MTPKQRDFCRFYVDSQNAYQSAIQAGYTKQYAKSKSGKMLENPDIVSEIQRLRSRVNERAEKSATDVVNEYSKIAFADRVSFLKEDPWRPGEYMYKAPHELTQDQRDVVERVNMRVREVSGVDADGMAFKSHRQEYTYILSDKANALQQMGRHFGIFDDKLKLIQSHQNPFKNASPEQLEKLKKSFVGIMSGEIVDGEFTESKKAPRLLPNG